MTADAKTRAITAAIKAIYGTATPILDDEQQRTVERIVDAVLAALEDNDEQTQAVA